MSKTAKPFRKEIKKIEKHQRKHGKESLMKPSKFHPRANENLRSDLMKKGIKRMAKHKKIGN